MPTDQYWLLKHLYGRTRYLDGNNPELDLLDQCTGQRILDLGCGDGRQARALLDMGNEVYGLDINEDAILLAQLQAPESWSRFNAGDVLQPLPFADEEFDAVLACLLLHYLPAWTEVLSEANRVLRPGGLFVASVQHPWTDFIEANSNAYSDTEKWIPKGFGGDGDFLDFWRRPLEQMVREVIRSGLEIVELLESAAAPPGGIPELLYIKARKRATDTLTEIE